MRAAPQRLAGDYTDNYSEDFTKSGSLEQRFEIKANTALITGAIDLMLRENQTSC